MTSGNGNQDPHGHSKDDVKGAAPECSSDGAQGDSGAADSPRTESSDGLTEKLKQWLMLPAIGERGRHNPLRFLLRYVLSVLVAALVVWLARAFGPPGLMVLAAIVVALHMLFVIWSRLGRTVGYCKRDHRKRGSDTGFWVLDWIIWTVSLFGPLIGLVHHPVVLVIPIGVLACEFVVCHHFLSVEVRKHVAELGALAAIIIAVSMLVFVFLLGVVFVLTLLIAVVQETKLNAVFAPAALKRAGRTFANYAGNDFGTLVVGVGAVIAFAARKTFRFFWNPRKAYPVDPRFEEELVADREAIEAYIRHESGDENDLMVRLPGNPLSRRTRRDEFYHQQWRMLEWVIGEQQSESKTFDELHVLGVLGGIDAIICDYLARTPEWRYWFDWNWIRADFVVGVSHARRELFENACKSDANNDANLENVRECLWAKRGKAQSAYGKVFSLE